ncbi:glycosyltransferase 87 family protein [Leifsonia sp. 22587]|uniref:glycosyltransferase 87 family protein n=1 Tax=Leifsonia sp. 22587 TaxID=3453946 RepID=UPI003F84C276
MRIAIVSVLLAALTALTAVATAGIGGFVPGAALALGIAAGAAGLIAGAAFLVLLSVRGRAAIVLVLAGSAALGCAALAGPPNLSTDSARYAWDGIVQDAGISPYAYVPAADALDRYRVAWLFPAPVTDADGSQACEGRRIQRTTSVPGGGALCTALNRPHAPTIYPPVAEAYFAAVRAVVPVDARYGPLQVSGLLLSLGTTVLLVAGMRARGLDPRWAAVWGWSPFVAAEAVTNSHVDVLGVLLVVAATFAAAPAVTGRLGAVLAGGVPGSRRRAVLVGVLVGLAAAAKFVPAIAAPALARRRPMTTALTAAVTFAVCYAPYVAVTGWGVIGYLPGYLDEEGYDSGSRFALLSPFLPGLWATAGAAVLILAALVLAWRTADPDAPWHAQVVSVGAVLLITSPSYPWYALVLIPFIALSRRWEWLAVPLALTAKTLVPAHPAGTLVVAAAALIVTTATLVRRRRRLAPRPPAPRAPVREETA